MKNWYKEEPNVLNQDIILTIGTYHSNPNMTTWESVVGTLNDVVKGNDNTISLTIIVHDLGIEKINQYVINNTNIVLWEYINNILKSLNINK